MIIKLEQARGPCDNCDSKQATHGVVLQGNTGRYCEVMWICEDCAIKWAGSKLNILETYEARHICNEDPKGWADF